MNPSTHSAGVDAVFDELRPDESREVALLLSSAREEYIRFFHPFPFTVEAVSALVAAARRDRFWGIRCGGELAGLVTLRGLDEGFAGPAFGIFIAERFSNRGLCKLALAHALEWLKANRIPTVILKVSKDHLIARRLYINAGFEPAGICPKSGFDILEKRLE